MKVKLYKYIDGDWRLVDYGFAKHTDLYITRGYKVIGCTEDELEPVWTAKPAPKRRIVKRPSVFHAVKSFFKSLIPTQEVCYA